MQQPGSSTATRRRSCARSSCCCGSDGADRWKAGGVSGRRHRSPPLRAGADTGCPRCHRPPPRSRVDHADRRAAGCAVRAAGHPQLVLDAGHVPGGRRTRLVTLGLGLLVGRAGMFSLCQIPMLAAGRLVLAAHRLQSVILPFPVLLLVRGHPHRPARRRHRSPGHPAERPVPGAHHADGGRSDHAAADGRSSSRTAAAASGVSTSSVASGRHVAAVARRRPTATSAFYRYTVVVVALCCSCSSPGTSRASRAERGRRSARARSLPSPPASTPRCYKLWAFALSAFVTGVAGALLAAGPGGVSVNQFPVEQSIVLLAVVLMGGVYNIWGAVVAGVLAAHPAAAARREAGPARRDR